MNDPLKRYQQLRDEVEAAKREEARLEGALDRLKAEIKSTLGVDAEEELEKLRKEQEKKIEALEAEFIRKEAEFLSTYKERLE